MSTVIICIIVFSLAIGLGFLFIKIAEDGDCLNYKLHRVLAVLLVFCAIVALASIFWLVKSCGELYKLKYESQKTYITSDGQQYNGKDVTEQADGFYITDKNGDLVKIDVAKIQQEKENG